MAKSDAAGHQDLLRRVEIGGAWRGGRVGETSLPALGPPPGPVKPASYSEALQLHFLGAMGQSTTVGGSKSRQPLPPVLGAASPGSRCHCRLLLSPADGVFPL